MTKKCDRSDTKARLSPTATLAHLSDEFIAELKIPELPESVPQRLAEAVERRVQAWLFQLREAKRRQYVPALEARIVRDAFRAVLTAYELKIPDSEVHYASFRKLVEELGYEHVDIGFRKRDGQHPSEE